MLALVTEHKKAASSSGVTPSQHNDTAEPCNVLVNSNALPQPIQCITCVPFFVAMVSTAETCRTGGGRDDGNIIIFVV